MSKYLLVIGSSWRVYSFLVDQLSKALAALTPQMYE